LNELDDKFSWVNIKELPSANKVYKVRAYIRPYTYGDMIRINKSTLDKHDRIPQYAKGIDLRNEDNTIFDPMNLTISDFFYLAYLRNLISSGGSKEFTTVWRCPHCKEGNEQDIDVSCIEFKDLEEDFPKTLEIEGEKEEWTFNPVTIGEYFLARPETPEKLLAMSCNKKEQEVMDCRDYLTLMAIDDAMNHSALPLRIICEHCKVESKMSFDVEDEDGTSSLVHPFP